MREASTLDGAFQLSFTPVVPIFVATMPDGAATGAVVAVVAAARIKNIGTLSAFQGAGALRAKSRRDSNVSNHPLTRSKLQHDAVLPLSELRERREMSLQERIRRFDQAVVGGGV